MVNRTTVNRVLLAVVGLVLLVGALLVLAGGFDAYHRLGVTPPSWWPLTSPHQPLLSNASRTRWRDRGWWWPAVVAGLALLVVLSVCWLAAQLRQSTPAEFELPTGGGGSGPGGGPVLRLRLRGAALASAVQDAALHLPEVTAARVRLFGSPHRARLRAQLLLEPGSDPSAAVTAFRDGPLAHACAAVGGELPLELRIQVAPSAAEHPTRERRARRGRGRKREPRVA
ncbi:alkaline shock response membrane anchor protein AmaP [Kitasatospora acidiphila]|uniref:Alkaline shock response membrane anchor protein AmaP n=1 Tax=Kitasatospora acidiphila TaxID=2567942 RepID=A0A540W1U1_9ACTN|nr:alkaline shock response membrane anchor protein AmaP [Kitasatospora acidiphila]TQF02971.1 alkaline shock response membrane anchor protein AmaP [Kitasatospora acidiphila]